MTTIGGLPVIAAVRTGVGLQIITCSNAQCSTSTTRTPEATGTSNARNPVIVQGPNGHPAVAFYNNDSIILTVCGDATCTTGNSVNHLVASADVGAVPGLAVTGGLLRITYFDETSDSIVMRSCADQACTSFGTDRTVAASVGWSNGDPEVESVVVVSGGNPLVGYSDPQGSLMYVQCTAADCASKQAADTIDSGQVGTNLSMTVSGGGAVWFAYRDEANDALKFAECTTIACSSKTAETIDDVTDTGVATSITGIGGDPIIAYFDNTELELRLGYRS